jgi:hypothetical protein
VDFGFICRSSGPLVLHLGGQRAEEGNRALELVCSGALWVHPCIGPTASALVLKQLQEPGGVESRPMMQAGQMCSQSPLETVRGALQA